MIKTSILSVLLITGGLAVHAQSTDSQQSIQDTSHRPHGHRDWKKGGRSGDQGGQAWGQPRHFDGRQRYDGRGQGEGRGRGNDPIRYSPEQRKQLLAINADYKKKEAALFQQDNLTLGNYKSQLVALQKDRKTKVRGLLTPEQQQQIVQSKQQASENQQVMAAGRLERMKIRLQLTDDQAARIKAQDEAFRTQMQSIRSNDDLLPEQKREQMRSLFSKQRDALTAVLTPDQQARLKTERHYGGRGGRREENTLPPANN